MALLDEPYPAHDERSYASNSSSTFYRVSQGDGVQAVSPAKLSSLQLSIGADSILNSPYIDMPTPASRSATITNSSGVSSPTSQLVPPPPGLPRSSSTAELVALGFIPADGTTHQQSGSAVDSAGYNSDIGGGAYVHRPIVLSSSRSGNGGMVGSPNGGSARREASKSGGGGGPSPAGGGSGDMSGSVVVPTSAGTGSAGGMGMGLKNHSLTNLANMVRSQSEMSFQSDIFHNGGGGGGSGGRMSVATDGPAWSSYPANLDKAGGGGAHAFAMSPASASLGAGSRGPSGLRSAPSSGGGSGGGDGGGVELSPPHFAGRGTAPRREVERGVPTWSSAMRASQRRPGVGPSGMDHGGVPAGRRAMVHNRSDTDLVASFSRLGFGHGGVSRWSPHMSPTASPLGAPLLEEDPLDLELEGNTHEFSEGDAFGTSFRSGERRGLSFAHAGGMGAGLPRHASYPSLALSHGGYGVEDLVQGAFEDLTVGDGAAEPGEESGSGGGGGLSASGVSSGGLSASGMGSGSLSGSARRLNGRVAAHASGAGMSRATSSGSLSAARGEGYSPSAAAMQGTNSSTLSPADHAISPAAAAQRPPQAMRHSSAEGARAASSRQRAHGGGGAHGHRPNSHSMYDQGKAGGMGGVDGVMMSDGRFVPTSQLMADGGGHPGMMYGDGGYGGGGGYDGLGGQMEVPWAAQDPVSLYQALLMKQSLAAAHASGIRFPPMMPANGMGMNMVDMATLAAAAQAATGRGGGYGAGGYGGHPGGGMDYGRRDGGPMRAGGVRGGVGMDAGGYMGGPMGIMPDVRGGMMGMGRAGGMYDVVEDFGDGNVYQVKFKRSTRNFLIGKTCQRDLQVGWLEGGSF